jgi:hypothetical protein
MISMWEGSMVSWLAGASDVGFGAFIFSVRCSPEWRRADERLLGCEHLSVGLVSREDHGHRVARLLVLVGFSLPLELPASSASHCWPWPVSGCSARSTVAKRGSLVGERGPPLLPDRWGDRTSLKTGRVAAPVTAR